MKLSLAAFAFLIAATSQAAELAIELPRLIQAAEIPGASMAVIRDGKVDWVGAAGMIAPGSTVPVRTDTVFRAASLTKPLVAYTVLRLADREGRPKYRLIPIGPTLFAFEGNGSVRARFAEDGSKLTILEDDGEENESARTPSAPPPPQ